ncbi:MAG: uracil-DNA glycosylase [Thiothrix sp.]|nr:uracil-DNA glycosylase [Thiothrix sp.]HPQ94197.1 uracil-DNA glycosylase [Thiolinea sp.]
MDITSQLHPSWLPALSQALAQPAFRKLQDFLQTEQQAGKSILPPESRRFNALTGTALDQVRVVILGQDPYPTAGHAHGLSFSVLPEVRPLPRSLSNINKELLSDLGIDNHHTGYLQPWAAQGVLLLNTVLSVEEGRAGSHQKKGWEPLTDAVIQAVNDHTPATVFILWGAQARKKAERIDTGRHQVITSAHPSPLSASRGFFGSRPFSRCNAFLVQNGREPVNWQL